MEQRQIKFRAWNPPGNRFLEYTSAVECLRQQLHFDYGHEKIGWNHAADGVIFQQYTGLKDKNGREIYEGDILKYSYYFDHGQSGELKPIDKPAVIKWTGLSFSPLTSWSDYCEQLKTCEIVGNICQNPELLKA